MGKLLVIACNDLDAMVQTALTEADVTRQARVRLLRGARAEEKRMASRKNRSLRCPNSHDEGNSLDPSARLFSQRYTFVGLFSIACDRPPHEA